MLLLGAINKLTNEYVHPKFAKKMEEYIGPECKKDLILCQGEIKIHYFRHKFDSNNPCNHYNNPGETALHKDAKELLKTILNKRVPIRIKRKCYDCSKYTIEINIDTINNGNVELEYRFEYNNNDRIADVAYLENNKCFQIKKLNSFIVIV